MTWVAWKMLTADKAKYFGLIFGIAFASLLMAHQVSMFVGIMRRTTSQILDITHAQIWVVDPGVQFLEETRPLADTDLHRVRGVEGVRWAVRLYKGNLQARLPDGSFRQIAVLGLDDATLVGSPQIMVFGDVRDLRRPDAFIIDKAGYEYLWPGEPYTLGKTLEMNDRRAVLVGVCKASPLFQTTPVVYTRYSQAMAFAPPERQLLSALLVEAEPGVPLRDVCDRIQARTGLQALTREEFGWKTIRYYLRSTGIPINFGITILLGFSVGAAIAGQTFYLFTVENLKQFGTLKAMGLSDLRIVGMILLQAVVVGLIGYGIGMGVAAAFFESTGNLTHLQGFFLPWPVMLITGIAVVVIVILASILSIRKVLILEPAIVFRG